MIWSLLRAATAALYLFLLTTPTTAQQGSACSRAMSCDCENIEAGLLTGPWRKDCNSCQAAMIERCEAAYPPLSSGLAAAGYCEDKCSVYGPNPYPAAPEPEGESSQSSFSIGTLRLACPLTMQRTTIEIDGVDSTGCVDGNGNNQGLFSYIDPETGDLVEILFVDGEEVERISYDPALLGAND